MQMKLLLYPRRVLALLFSFLALFPLGFAFSQDAVVLPERFAQVEEWSGEVQVKVTAEDGWKIAEKGMRVQQSGEIRTGKDSKAVLLMDENDSAGKVDVYSNTWLRMGTLGYSAKDSAKRTLLDLASGQILVKAQGVAGEGTFQIRSPTSTSSVRGSEATFEVKVEEE